MSFWKIAWRNMKQRALASSLTGLSMALGVAVMVCVIVIHSVAVRQFSQDAQGYHLLVGGTKGSANDLVLTTVFHVGKANWPVPYAYYREFTDGKYSAVTKVAVPYCLGDSYESEGRLYRVVGVSTDLFDKIQYSANRDGTPKMYEFAEGRNFSSDHCFEAVVGSLVARQAGLRVGSNFNPTHGLSAEGEKHNSFKVVGVLKPTGTANDRALFVNIEGFFLLDGHSISNPPEGVAKQVVPTLQPEKIKGHVIADPCYDNDGNPVEPLPLDQRQVTSVLVLCNNPFGSNSILTMINKDSTAAIQAIAPQGVVAKLLNEFVGPIRTILLTLTIMIVIVASISILVSIYNSMSERSHDIAVMRALGASRVAVMLIVLFESILLSVAGGLAGILLGHLLIGVAAPYVVETTGVRLAVWEFDRWELVVIPALVVLASLAGLLPAVSAYRTDVSRALAGGR